MQPSILFQEGAALVFFFQEGATAGILAVFFTPRARFEWLPTGIKSSFKQSDWTNQKFSVWLLNYSLLVSIYSLTANVHDWLGHCALHFFSPSFWLLQQ